MMLIDNCVFRLNGRNRLAGLEDVAYLTGLNIDGDLVLKGTANLNILGTVPRTMLKANTCSVKMSWLKSEFEKVPQCVDRKVLEKHVIALICPLHGRHGNITNFGSHPCELAVYGLSV